MKAEVNILSEYDSEKKSEAIAKSLEVDNYSDSRLSIKTEKIGKDIKTEIHLNPCEDEAKGISTLSNTINDLILSLKTSEELLK